MKKISLVISFLILNLSSSSLANEKYRFDYSLDESTNCEVIEDPFESVNRKIFYFNSFLDHIILKPLARAYDRLPEFSKARVGSVLDNINEPLTTVNYTLQGNINGSLSSFWRFVINTTIGAGGLFDVASQNGLTVKQQSLGSTLAYYGVSSGPYLVLPILGSTSMRDMWDGIGADEALNPVRWSFKANTKAGYSVVKIIHRRSEILPFTDYITKTAIDPYAAIKSSYHQTREKNLNYPYNYKCGKKVLNNN